jgi:hypothetical protein
MLHQRLKSGFGRAAKLLFVQHDFSLTTPVAAGRGGKSWKLEAENAQGQLNLADFLSIFARESGGWQRDGRLS